MAREMEGVQKLRAGPSQGGKRPEDMNPQELHSALWQVLSFRDSGMSSFSLALNIRHLKLTNTSRQED